MSRRNWTAEVDNLRLQFGEKEQQMHYKGGRTEVFRVRVTKDWLKRLQAAADAYGVTKADVVVFFIDDLTRRSPLPPIPRPPLEPKGRGSRK